MSGKGPDQAVRTKLLIVDDGEKFVRLLRDYLDIMLPGLNGLDLLRELRRDSHVPVLMLTALGDAAHELRSPLGRMQVVLGVLEDRVKSEDKPYLRDLQKEVDFMAGLTMEVLTFARAGMRPENVDLVPLNLRPIVERAVASRPVDPLISKSRSPRTSRFAARETISSAPSQTWCATQSGMPAKKDRSPLPRTARPIASWSRWPIPGPACQRKRWNESSRPSSVWNPPGTINPKEPD
ncbi:MAG: hybrid sensor histidine kinase/response regulator [Bryobacterales bacterium]|nr:hybrid sensor histidine kinase/response regulator [Bryobacterales bacterium]